jgi:putative membrane protein
MAGNPIRKISIFLLAFASALMVRTAVAQGPSDADKQFVRMAIESNNAEIAAAHLALGQASGNDVKQFAQTMIHDHTLLNNQMKPLAQKLDVQVAPGQVDPKDQALAAQLKDLRGMAFDLQYIAGMMQGHQAALQLVQTEASNGQDPTVKMAAQKAEPVIQKHLQMAQQLANAHHVQTGKP